MEVLRLFLRFLWGIAGTFFLFMSFLQIQDGFVGYGFVSIGIGSLCWFLVYRSIQKRKNF
jgi:hypothetical protein